MDINCASLLFCNERDLVASLSDDTQADFIGDLTQHSDI